MHTIMHCCLDIEGGIKHAKDLIGCITVDGRTLTSTDEIKGSCDNNWRWDVVYCLVAIATISIIRPDAWGTRRKRHD